MTWAGREVLHVTLWQAAYVVGFVGFILLLLSFRARAPSARAIILGAILLRLPLLAAAPNDDCNRYAWEGRIQSLGFNPYSVAPSDPRLEPFRDDVWESVNKKHYTTIYPPLAEIEFRLLATLHYGVKTVQIAHTVLDIAVVLALVGLLSSLGRPVWHAAIYALCPLVLASFAHAGHNDPLMNLCLVGFIAAATGGRWRWAGVCLGLAILAKTVPAILLAPLIRRSRIAVATALVVVLLGYLPYAGAGWHLFHTLHDFPSQGHFNNLFDQARSLVCGLLDVKVTGRMRNIVGLVLLASAAGYRVMRPRDLFADARWLLALSVLLLPIIHFWYLTWPLVLIALAPRGLLPWLLLVGTMTLYWQAEYNGQTTGHWELPGWTVAAIWLPFFAACLGEALWTRARKKA